MTLTTGLDFRHYVPPVASSPNRADIACFIGLVRRRQIKGEQMDIPPAIIEWLDRNGWLIPPKPSERPHPPLNELRDLPIPIDSWDVFDFLFEWENRSTVQTGQQTPPVTYLGAAVRSFFAQGGRKCYVVRVGDPLPYGTERASRMNQLAQLLPGYPSLLEINPVDRQSWWGIGHLYGLPDVSFVCLPDLPELVGVDHFSVMSPPAPVFEIPEQFSECSDDEPDVVPDDDPAKILPAPRCDEAGYADWARAVHLVGDLLKRHLREVQLVAALPLPQLWEVPSAPSALSVPHTLAPDTDLMGYLVKRADSPLSSRLDNGLQGIASAFVQLGFPWLQTRLAERLPEGLEPPDAVLVGILARNTMVRGAFRSAAQQQPSEIGGVYPELSRGQMHRPYLDHPLARTSHSLMERVSLFGPTPQGLALLSDVTTSLDEIYRSAAVNRLVSVIVRAARRIGEESVFEPSGQRLWASLKDRMESLLFDLLELGALRGPSAAEAFDVRCDRTTMTQNDIDNGRVIVQVIFNAAAPIETITILLAMNEGGRVSLQSGGAS